MNKHNNNQQGFSLVEVVVVIMVFACIGVLGFFAYGRLKDNKQTSDKAQDSMSTDFQPDDMTSKITSTLAKNYTLLDTGENNNPKTKQISIRSEETSPPYKVEGFDFYNDYKGGSTLNMIIGGPDVADGTLPAQADIDVRTVVAAEYTKSGLKYAETYGDKDSGSETDVYYGKGLICTVEPPKTPATGVNVSCGSIKSYKAAAEKTKPLADEIPGLMSNSTLIRLNISRSSETGYQRADVGMGSIEGGGGSIVLLYKKDAEPWKYFKNTQSPLPCSEYSSPDIKSAFQGEECYGVNDEMDTVK